MIIKEKEESIPSFIVITRMNKVLPKQIVNNSIISSVPIFQTQDHNYGKQKIVFFFVTTLFFHMPKQQQHSYIEAILNSQELTLNFAYSLSMAVSQKRDNRIRFKNSSFKAVSSSFSDLVSHWVWHISRVPLTLSGVSLFIFNIPTIRFNEMFEI